MSSSTRGTDSTVDDGALTAFGLILISGAFISAFSVGFAIGICGAPLPNCNNSNGGGGRGGGCNMNSSGGGGNCAGLAAVMLFFVAFVLVIAAGLFIGHAVGRGIAPVIGVAAAAVVSAPATALRHADESFQTWMGHFGANPDAAQEHLRCSGQVMLVGTTLSLICMVVAMACPWAVVENPSAGSDAHVIFLYVYYGAALKASFASFFPDANSEPLLVSSAVDSLATVSSISCLVLSLSLASQLLAFAATIRTWMALNSGPGANRVCAREASMQLNALTFFMMIFCCCTYLNSFNNVISALGSPGSFSSAVQPGLGFAFASALLSFLSVLMVSGLGFRKAWRHNVAGEVGATSPLLPASARNAARAEDSSTIGAAKSVHPHLLRELLEAAQAKETECPVCLDKITIENGKYTECGHLFCKNCVEELTAEKGLQARCPACRADISPRGAVIETRAPVL